MYQQVYDPVADLAWAHLTIRTPFRYPHVYHAPPPRCHVGVFKRSPQLSARCVPGGDGSCRDSRLSHALLGTPLNRPGLFGVAFSLLLTIASDSRQRDVDL